VEVAVADWWQEFSMADDATREDLVNQARELQRTEQRNEPRAQPKSNHPKPSSVREPRVHVVAPDNAVDAVDALEAEIPLDGSAPAKKRRRRRRSGAARSEDGAGSAGEGAPQE
jgi:poly(A) polymerase